MNICWVFVFTENNSIVAVGEDGIIIRTTDGGVSWDLRSITELLSNCFPLIFDNIMVSLLVKMEQY